ncbi:MAG: hypothetical protein HQM14_18215 [SAR324 cluster bacterium]|nr:hypothetical protein [SAR324 cluster bacterium]
MKAEIFILSLVQKKRQRDVGYGRIINTIIKNEKFRVLILKSLSPLLLEKNLTAQHCKSILETN